MLPRQKKCMINPVEESKTVLELTIGLVASPSSGMSAANIMFPLTLLCMGLVLVSTEGLRPRKAFLKEGQRPPGLPSPLPRMLGLVEESRQVIEQKISSFLPLSSAYSESSKADLVLSWIKWKIKIRKSSLEMFEIFFNVNGYN